jgi:hypothetical protein
VKIEIINIHIRILLGCESNNNQFPTYWLIRVNRSLPECEFNRLETTMEKAMIR